MNCFYCDKIAAGAPKYAVVAAEFDLGSAAPRCKRHWRYVCGQCGKPAHFMSTAFCLKAGQCFCARCATGKREVVSSFWAWKYYFELLSPWSGEWRRDVEVPLRSAIPQRRGTRRLHPQFDRRADPARQRIHQLADLRHACLQRHQQSRWHFHPRRQT